MTSADRIPYHDLGELTVAFAWLDLMTHLLAWNLMGLDEDRGAAITDGMTIERVTELAKRVARQREADPELDGLLGERVRQCVAANPDLVRQRNAVTHAIWRTHPGGFGAARLWEFNRSKGEKLAALRHVAPEQVSILAADCWTAVGRLIDTNARLLGFEGEDLPDD